MQLPTQKSLPVECAPHEVARKKSLGAAIALCAELAGLEPKQICAELALDKAQWSRWESGSEGVIWPKLDGLMDLCGNNAPLLWMAQARGYDLSAMRPVESSLERDNRILREQNAALLSLLKGSR